MFFATTNPAFQGRSAFRPTNRSLERFMTAALQGSHAQACTVAQDDTSYTLSFDVPGISREQLSIGIEGSVVRIDTTEEKKVLIVEKVKEKFSNNTDPNIRVNLIDGIRISFPDGWALARSSNTQPVLVVRFESTSEVGLKRIEESVMSVVKKYL